jgi:hypothetical protein
MILRMNIFFSSTCNLYNQALQLLDINLLTPNDL